MTEYIEQTSASDRIEAARKALAWYDDQGESGGGIVLGGLAVRDALEALITPPTTHESLSEVALKIHAAALSAAEDAGIQITTDLDSIMRNATNRAVYAGIQSAHETWECETAQRPSQEQMLRWLGIEHAVARDDESGELEIFVPSQHIEREEV